MLYFMLTPHCLFLDPTPIKSRLSQSAISVVLKNADLFFHKS